MNPSPAAAPQFLLLLRQPDGEKLPNPAQMAEIMGKFAIWMNGIKTGGHFVSTNGLETTGRVLRAPRGTPASDGPFAEAKEIVGGYVLITAVDLDAATAIAQHCPGLDYHLTVEVRPVRPRPA